MTLQVVTKLPKTTLNTSRIKKAYYSLDPAGGCTNIAYVPPIFLPSARADGVG